MPGLEEVKNNPVFTDFMLSANKFIGATGAIEHSVAHAERTSELASYILTTLGYPPREAELASIAGYLHDIGNLVNRYGHGLSGAILAFYGLMEMGMDTAEVATIVGAIGNHEENAGGRPVNNVAAAITLADKSDVNRVRVRKSDMAAFTPRDRVNYAVTDSRLLVDDANKIISMHITIDTAVCSVMEYFEIFLTKMLMCKRAAEFLHCEFHLLVNDTRLL